MGRAACGKVQHQGIIGVFCTIHRVCWCSAATNQSLKLL
ncbi:hypothetical protein OOU_Y34scaffold00476g4 [Pyricularia oryzae Y34]|uniref:Uncharacterized protein n=2 Tax=Pyricularia oryzae TaxID=318829 RepID=A0AA97PMC1_PYRO3|nr:hypothetical protein OOU_Y34scaffold00476g4 [Pyricularia oryzae Y34]